MSEPLFADTPEVRDTILRSGELAATLTLSEGQKTFDLRTFGRFVTGLDKLLRAIAKEVAPTERAEPVIVRVDLLEPNLRLIVSLRAIPKGAKRRARILAVKVEPVDRLTVYGRDKGRCGVCGRFVSRATFEVDHVRPLSKGGAHSYANVQVAHAACNKRKSARLVG